MQPRAFGYHSDPLLQGQALNFQRKVERFGGTRGSGRSAEKTGPQLGPGRLPGRGPRLCLRTLHILSLSHRKPCGPGEFADYAKTNLGFLTEKDILGH